MQRCHTIHVIESTNHVEAHRGEAPIVVGTDRIAILTPGDAIVIGRQGNHRVDDQRVSRQHLSVTLSYTGLMCRDLGSSNGSWLIRGDRRIPLHSDATTLTVGDRVVTIDDVELVRVPEVSA